MLTYNFENIDGSLYEHLYKCIKNDINNGNLNPNDHLPSKRTLAKNIGVSTITVQNAYDQLISEGYVYALTKKGYYVADISGMNKIKKKIAVHNNVQLPPAHRKYAYELSSNQVNPKNFPFSIWAKIIRETISLQGEELMTNSPSGGIDPLRAAIANHLRSFRGMAVDPDQIVVGAGTEYLYGLIIQLVGKGKCYCTENPGYGKMVQIYRSHGVKCHFADIDDKGIALEGLQESGADIAHISPTHHFPTGITMPISRRYEILAWANEKDTRYVIEDDYDSEFRLNGKPIPSLQSIDACEKVIYMNTFSKSLASTIRISYMVLPVHLANQFYKQLSFYSCTVSTFEQYTLAKFIGQGYFEKHINRMRLFYARQRRQVLDVLADSELSKKCKIIENDSGLHFLLQFDTKISAPELARRFQEKNLHMAALSEYFHEYKKEAVVERMYLLNYSNLNLENLNEAFSIINQCL